MRREVNDIVLGDGSHRYVVRIYDSPSPPETHEAYVAFVRFLRALGDQPQLLDCGFHRPQQTRIVHDGTSWVCEVEATFTEE